MGWGEPQRRTTVENGLWLSNAEEAVVAEALSLLIDQASFNTPAETVDTAQRVLAKMRKL